MDFRIRDCMTVVADVRGAGLTRDDVGIDAGDLFGVVGRREGRI